MGVYYARGRRVLRARSVARVERRTRSARRCARSSRGPRSCSFRPRRRSSPASRRTPAPSGAGPRASGSRGGPRSRRCRTRMRGQDPGAGPAPRPGEARGIRAADGAARLPRRRLALRRLPVPGVDPAVRRARRSRGPSCRSRSRRTAKGPLRSIGWKIELVYLPVSALLSAALLYRAHRKRRLRSLGRRRRRARRRSTYRTRVAVTAGIDPARPRLAAARPGRRGPRRRAACATRSSRG